MRKKRALTIAKIMLDRPKGSHAVSCMTNDYAHAIRTATSYFIFSSALTT